MQVCAAQWRPAILLTYSTKYWSRCVGRTNSLIWHFISLACLLVCELQVIKLSWRVPESPGESWRVLPARRWNLYLWRCDVTDSKSWRRPRRRRTRLRRDWWRVAGIAAACSVRSVGSCRSRWGPPAGCATPPWSYSAGSNPSASETCSERPR